MSDFTAEDLAIVIPTRDRWDILDRTLAALSSQSVTGFETIVVVDGTDQQVPALDANRVLVGRRAGPGAARNAGARATERRVVMFLGDDTIPASNLVEQHLAAHRRHPDHESAVVGFVDWHPDVADNKINRWLEWSGTQSWYGSLADEGEQEVSHWFFYTSNISVKREFLLAGDGFDEDFPFAAFEDLECGLRLSGLGLRLYYEPDATCYHLHNYDWPGLSRRFATMALSERLMVEKHPDLEAGCLTRMKAASLGHALPLEALVDVVPRRWKWLDQLVRRQADRRYHRRLAPVYLEAWDQAVELCELRRYLGSNHDSARLVYRSGPRVSNRDETSTHEAGARESEELFELARRGLEGTGDPALTLLRRHFPPGSTILEYGCGIGSQGLRLAQDGYSVCFADNSGTPLDYLKWRVAARGLCLPVYDLDNDELPDDIDVAFCLYGADRIRNPIELLDRLGRIAPNIALGFAETHEPPHTSVPSELLISRPGRRLVSSELSSGWRLLIFERCEGDLEAAAITKVSPEVTSG